MREDESLRVEARGGLVPDVFAGVENLHGGTCGDALLFATTAGGVRVALSLLRGVKPGEFKAAFKGRTMDKGDGILIFWGQEEEGEETGCMGGGCGGTGVSGVLSW